MNDAAHLVVALVLLCAGIALAVVAVLALTGRLRRNRWAGVRTPSTMASPDAFATGNRVAAPPMLLGAVFLLLAAAASAGLSGALATVAVALCVIGTAATVVSGGLLGNRAAAAGCAPQRCAECTGCDLLSR